MLYNEHSVLNKLIYEHLTLDREWVFPKIIASPPEFPKATETIRTKLVKFYMDFVKNRIKQSLNHQNEKVKKGKRKHR